MSIPDEWDPEDREMAAYEWCDALWLELSGWVALLVGEKPHYMNGKYQHARMVPYFGRWPEQRDDIVRSALLDGEEHDVYVAPLLRTSRSRRKGTGIPGRHLWADLDSTGTDAVSERLKPFRRDSDTMLVSSGRNLHLYVMVDRRLSLERLTEMNRRLAKHLDGDAKFTDESLLRLPGTFNHKERVRGGLLLPVKRER